MDFSRALLIGVTLVGLLMTGCTSKVTDTVRYSGFLPNYQNLQEVSTPSGGTALRWVSPSWNPNSYDMVMFDQLERYPAPTPTERINQQTLDDIQNYMTTKAKEALGQKYRVVSSASTTPVGAKTLFMRAVITGVSASNEGMKWYEVVPIAAAVGIVQAASGHRDQDTELFMEAEFTDVNNQTVAKVVRKLFGTQLSNASQEITAIDFKTAIDNLSVDLQTLIR